MSNFDDDMRNSNNHFHSIVWPELKDWFGDGVELFDVEERDSTLADKFDTIGGVDFWAVERDAGMVSLASRVQTYDKTTFTIRYRRASGNETEYQKRLRQLNTHHELPTYTIQAYVDPLLKVMRNAAVVDTARLYEHVSDGTPGEDWPLIDSNETEQFFPVGWAELDEQMPLYVHDRARAGLSTMPTNPEDITEWGDA